MPSSRSRPRRQRSCPSAGVLASRTSAIFDLGYANPLMPYVVTQNDTARNGTDVRDNLQVFGGVRWRSPSTPLAAT